MSRYSSDLARFELLEARLLMVAGSYDEDFSFNGRLSADVLLRSNVTGGIALQLDGKILVAGTTHNGSNGDITLMRFNTDGSTDKTFGPGEADGDGRILKDFAGFTDIVTCMALQRDGKIVVAGQTTYQLKLGAFVARFNRDGSIDSSFDGDGFALPNFGTPGAIINEIAIQDDGSIVAVATVPTPQNAAHSNIGVARLTEFGSPDFTFSGNGTGVFDMGSANDAGNGIAIQPDGKIVVVGIGDGTPNTIISELFLLRLEATGTPDLDFDVDGKVFKADSFDAGARAGAQDVVVLPSGRIAVCGFSGKYATIWFFNADGSSLSSQGRTLGPSSILYSIAASADNLVTAAGTYEDAGRPGVMVFQGASPRSTPFAGKRISSTYTFANQNDAGTELAVQPDGKLLIAGTSDTRDTGSTKADFGLLRLLAFDDTAGSISGRVFKDRNGNGVRNSNDNGHTAVRVYIDQDKDAKFDKNTEPSVLTDANGKYTIPGLPPGPYRIRQLIPKGFRQSLPLKAYYNMTLEDAEHVRNKDFGNTVRPLVSGRVFRDDNANGLLDDGEQGMKNFTVFVDDDRDGKFDNDEESTITDETGRWNLSVDAGAVVVRIVPRDGFTRTTTSRFRLDLDPAEVSSDHLFGQRRIT